MEEIKQYLVDECAYDSEPLHLLIRGALDHGIFGKPEEIVGPLCSLLSEGLVRAYEDSGTESDPYVLADGLTSEKLLSYVGANSSHGFSVFPEPEYYIQTTENGWKFVSEEASE